MSHADTDDVEDLRNRVRLLEHQLEVERMHSKQLEEDKRRLRQACVSLQLHAEQDEEHISNSLLKRIRDLEAEKKKLEDQGQNSEHMQAQLEQLQKEKATVENKLEVETDSAVNKLCREKEKLEAYNHKLEEQLQRCSPVDALKASQHLVTELSREVLRLRQLAVCKTGSEHGVKLLEDNESLKEENLRLTRKLHHVMERMVALERASVRTENDIEVDDERQFNLRRSHDSSLHSSVHSSGTASPIPSLLPSPHRPIVVSPISTPAQSTRGTTTSPSPAWWPHARLDRLEGHGGKGCAGPGCASTSLSVSTNLFRARSASESSSASHTSATASATNG